MSTPRPTLWAPVAPPSAAPVESPPRTEPPRVSTGSRRALAPGWLASAWRDRGRGVGIAVAVTLAASVLAAVTMPRGPVTTAAAVALVVGALLVGAVLGLLLRSRWALLLGPALVVVAFELWWLTVDGPMTDALPWSLMGLLVVVFGRGWLALLALLPMAVGAAGGLGLARRLDHGLHDVRHLPPARTGGGIVTGIAALGVAVLLAGLLRPATTPAVVDDDGQTVAGSIAELTSIEVGGHEQAVLVRGVDATNPVLLYLAGGPGGSDLGAMRLFGGDLEQDFVVVSWDQRGTGKSYAALDPRETLTLEQAVADVVELTDHLRARFGQDRVYLLGNSWGTTIGVLAAQRHPDRYHAVVGAGQMVSQRETDVRMYEAMVSDAFGRGDQARLDQLEQLGPPPFDDVRDYAPMLVQPSDQPATEWPANVMVSEYTLVEQVTTMPALVETFATLYPQLQELDFRRDVPALDVPTYVVDGAGEDPARSDLAAEWLAALDAPTKRHVVLDGAAHRPHLQQPEAFAAVMRAVLADTWPATD